MTNLQGHDKPVKQLNGDARNHAPPAMPTDDIDAAVAMPNIDNKPSVLEDLPADLFVDYREGFAVREEAVTADDVVFKRPGSQQVARCHPDLARKKVVWGLKDGRNNRGELHVLPQSMLDQYPRLKPACKLYSIRQYITDDGMTGLWPAPLPGTREAASDASHLAAQENAVERWVRVEWSGNKFVC